jgi:hypothetical protein
MDPWWRRTLDRLREAVHVQESLHERQQLLARPWEEEFLHWAWDGQEWQLHGRLVAPGPQRRGATADGWCPHVPRTRSPGGRTGASHDAHDAHDDVG